LLEELRRRGYPYAPEVARQIIQEQVRQGGTALPWANCERYTALMLERSIESFLQHTPTTSVLFADRGIPDTLAYARLIDLNHDASIRDACQQYRYASPVFLAPAWREIYHIDNERKQDFDEAQRTAYLLRLVYQECGYENIELPRATPSDRADFVLDVLKARGVLAQF
jgi:predicted ATPase